MDMINKSQKVKDCIEILEDKLKFEDLDKDVRAGIGGAKSLMDRHVLILYWVLRKRGAKYLSYNNIPQKERDKLFEKPEYRDGEISLCERYQPEKQHLVPYSHLKNIYKVEKRPGKHEINDIGNLTYISQAENHFDTGLGGIPIKIEEEKSKENLEAHFLKGKKELRENYENANNVKSNSEAKEHFVKFCEIRRDLILEGFREFITDTRHKAQSIKIERIEPAPREFNPTEYDFVYEMDYPDEIEDELIEIINTKARISNKKLNKENKIKSRCEIFRATSEFKKKSKGFDIYLFPDRIEVERCKNDISERLSKEVFQAQEPIIKCPYCKKSYDVPR